MGLVVSGTKIYTYADQAVNFVAGVMCGAHDYDHVVNFENIYGPGQGFVYFAYIGADAPVYVKVGFSKYDPRKRLKNLQTGCPFPIKLLGFVIGHKVQEEELHDVLRGYRVQGEWFDYSDYVESVIHRQLHAEAP